MIRSPRLLLAIRFSFVLLLGLATCTPSPEYDVIIRGGTLYDGSGNPPVTADLALQQDTIAAVGDLAHARARTEVDARGLAVAPGFINMLSWAGESLLVDGRSQSDIRQGVTLEVFGEGWSMGPLNDTMKADRWPHSDSVQWTTLGEYLGYLVAQGVSPNVASFVGATTVRIHELGYADRRPTAVELSRMEALVRSAMEEGALGVGSSLIYAPAFYAKTDELVALARGAAEYDGVYISHMRDEGNQMMDALEELITIARDTRVRAEIYHLKVKGEKNWHKLDEAIHRIEQAQTEGLAITANMYTYHASSTGLNATMPPWVQEGGLHAWIDRLRDPSIRQRLRREMTEPAIGWTNNLELAGSPENVLLVGFRSEVLKPLTGKTLAEVARLRGTSPAITAMDLVIEDSSRVSAVYFVMDEANIRKKVTLPWVSFGSDGSSIAAEGDFLNTQPHPRAYGNFARLLGRYVRDEQVIPLEEAVRRLTSLPATTLKLDRRGALRPGYFADVVVFDASTVQDHATYALPHAYATGVLEVWVNGVQVLRGGTHTGALPGRVVRGPGYEGR